MAKAAAKKAAAARKDASNIYTPILVATNLVYACLLLGFGGGGGAGAEPVYPSRWHWMGAVATIAEQIYAYVGILDHAEANASSSSSSSSRSRKKKNNNKNLPGGSSLDLFAATVVVQLASVLHSPRWLWVSLVVVPLVGAYQLYETVSGGNGSGIGGIGGSSSAKTSKSSNPTTTTGDDDDEPSTARRQRRAEKRRQKWG